LYVKVAGKNIGELSEMPVKDLKVWFTEAVKKFFRV
jgi:excinuclease ABC subunit A